MLARASAEPTASPAPLSDVSTGNHSCGNILEWFGSDSVLGALSHWVKALIISIL